MLFGTKAPLWKYMLGIFTLMLGARSVATLVMAQQLDAPLWFLLRATLQVLSALTLAFGLFRVHNR